MRLLGCVFLLHDLLKPNMFPDQAAGAQGCELRFQGASLPRHRAVALHLALTTGCMKSREVLDRAATRF